MKNILLISTYQMGAYSHVIYHVLQKMGFMIYRFDHRALIYNYGAKYTNEYLEEITKAIDFDYILSIKGRGLYPNVIKDIPAKKVLWWFDSPLRYSDFDDYIDVYDKYYVVEEGWGHPWMATGIDSDIHRRIETTDEKYKSDLVFCGTSHPERSKRIINIMRNMPWTSKIWGNSWSKKTPNWAGNAIYWDELYKAYSSSKLILNAHYVRGKTPNMRSIEAPASRTALISDTGTGLEKCLVKGKEYIAYDTIKEAKRLILKYLEDEEEREEIARAGQQKVYKRHLLKDKLVELLK